MGMGSGGGGAAPSINVTPLIDILLVLLIIFMVITPLKPARFKTLVPEIGPGDLVFEVRRRRVACGELADYRNRERPACCVLFAGGGWRGRGSMREQSRMLFSPAGSLG
jgi:hypothetical protein